MPASSARGPSPLLKSVLVLDLSYIVLGEPKLPGTKVCRGSERRTACILVITSAENGRPGPFKTPENVGISAPEVDVYY